MNIRVVCVAALLAAFPLFGAAADGPPPQVTDESREHGGPFVDIADLIERVRKKTGKQFDDFVFYPAKFLGYTASAQAQQAAPGVKDEAVAVVTTLLADGPLTRAQLISKLSAKLVGNPNSNAIIGLAIRDDFHTGAPWTRDQSGTISL